MIEFLEWFQINYPYLKKSLQECQHNFDDRDTNPYHIEGDCWSHTMMVCKIAELRSYDKVVQVSALLHDIGKPQSRKINPKNNHVQFFGHEELSANIAKPLVDDLVQREMITLNESEEILKLISLHSYLYKESDHNIIYKKFKKNLKLFKHLVELGNCDDLGRFSKTMNKSILDTDSIIRKIEENSI